MDPTQAFAIAGIVIFIGFLSSLLFEKTKISDVLLLILLGLIIGQTFKTLSQETFKDVTLETEFVFDEKIKQFHSEFSFFVRTFFFVYLGLVFTLSALSLWFFAVSIPFTEGIANTERFIDFAFMIIVFTVITATIGVFITERWKTNNNKKIQNWKVSKCIA